MIPITLGPVAHGGDHVLADAESRDGVIAPASGLVIRISFLRLGDAVEDLFQPPVAQRERFMPRESRCITLLV